MHVQRLIKFADPVLVDDGAGVASVDEAEAIGGVRKPDDGNEVVGDAHDEHSAAEDDVKEASDESAEPAPTMGLGSQSAGDGAAVILRTKTSDDGLRQYLVHDPTSNDLLWTDESSVPAFMLDAFKTNARDRAFRRRARDLERGVTNAADSTKN